MLANDTDSLKHQCATSAQKRSVTPVLHPHEHAGVQLAELFCSVMKAHKNHIPTTKRKLISVYTYTHPFLPDPCANAFYSWKFAIVRLFTEKETTVQQHPWHFTHSIHGRSRSQLVGTRFRVDEAQGNHYYFSAIRRVLFFKQSSRLFIRMISDLSAAKKQGTVCTWASDSVPLNSLQLVLLRTEVPIVFGIRIRDFSDGLYDVLKLVSKGELK